MAMSTNFWDWTPSQQSKACQLFDVVFVSFSVFLGIFLESGEDILKELKKIFDSAIKPLETMYKYRDLSNRHFGDPEIFSKSLVLFMGPYSGGKSTILNYLTENEYTPNSIRSGTVVNFILRIEF